MHTVATLALRGQLAGAAVDEQAGLAYLTDVQYADKPSATVAVVDMATGGVVRRLPVAAHAGALIATRPGRLLVIQNTLPGRTIAMSVLDTASGATLRTETIGPNVQAAAVDAGANRLFIAVASPTGRPGPGRVRVFDATSGAPLGATMVGDDPGALSVDGRRGVVLVLNRDGDTISLLDARSGALRRTVRAGTSPQLVGVDAGAGHAVVVDGDGTIETVDTRSGGRLRTARGVGQPGGILVDGATHRAFVAYASSDQVGVVDTRSGRLLRPASVPAYAAQGQPPFLDALDLRMDRVFVSAAGRPNNRGDEIVGSGHVGVLDARTGLLIRTYAVGSTPRIVAFDARRGRALLLPTNVPDAPTRLSLLDVSCV